MRTMRLSLVGTLMLLLLGGSAVLAQETEEPTTASAPIVVTGTLRRDATAATDGSPRRKRP